MQKNGFGTRGDESVERTWELRHRRILMTLGRVQPTVVLVELFPFGRAKFARELVPLLEEARAMGAFTACSLRDILVSGDGDRDDRARRLADEHLDAVFVHCDPSFARLEETFKPSQPLGIPVHYTGFVAGRNGAQRPPPRRAHRRLRGRRARRPRRCSRRPCSPPTAARCARSPAR